MCPARHLPVATLCLNESPSQKEGKSVRFESMETQKSSLNESPSQKEGKYVRMRVYACM